MAKQADDLSTSITLITLAAARVLATETLLSKRYAEAQILKWLHDGLIRWQYERVFGIQGPNRTLAQEAEGLWSYKTVMDFEEGLARKVTCYRADRRTPVRHIDVIGIRVAREDIEHQLAQIPRVQLGIVASQQSLPKKKPPAETSSQAKLSAKERLYAEFEGARQPIDLKAIAKRQKIKLKTVQNRYSEWKRLPKRPDK
jgi:hypothetical protein